MESQNHFYGHSAAFAVYAGRPRPRHIHGLVQHGWTAVSPVQTHFRDFPKVGLDAGSRRRLLVWSHESRAWDPREERHTTTPVGAQFAYLARAAGPTPKPRDERDEVVLMPVHGIQTQRVRGDHAGLARLWREQEGPATACLYAADAADPDILGAYTGAGHRVVVLGERMDAEFLWRLWTMLGRARRVVSNRLSTPVLYGGHLGADLGVYGDALRIDGESDAMNQRVRQTWPELHGQHLDPATAGPVVDRELGVQHLLPPGELERLLGWRGLGPAIPATEFWTTSVVSRAVINLRRRADAPAAPPAATEEAPTGLAFGPWLRAAMSYLPRPLPRTLPAAGQLVEPIEVRPAAWAG
ncbi:hypothetical protein [Phycicoccus sp. Soil802]|uniref:hypothetical protein n=1 Tax=Phycicoccus sp. Soil802 TaxID=1736414 RepID=UPI000702D6AA|nr:hypothetical protein [Phycicoccus sp. Soil802]KRF27205.1 hypothetical protein ASG91_11980 [Phycicoccus sp. Soil802]